MDEDRLRRELVERLGAESVRWDEQSLAEHARDWWTLTLLRRRRGARLELPACVVTPDGVEQVSAVLRYANERGVPVVPFGGGSGVCGGILPPAGAVVVDVRRLARLREVDETALLACAEAGIVGERLEAELAARGYSMGHWPQSVSLSTLGGWIATRAAGQFSTRYGAIEDMVVGLEAVLADGSVVRIRPVPRRSTGPDLRHLFLGSEGTVGIVTEATVRIFPRPERRVLLCHRFDRFEAGLEAIRTIVRAGWRPPVARLYDRAETGRHFGEWAAEGDCFLLLVTEGPEALAVVEGEACELACRAAGGRPVGEGPVRHWLQERNHVPDLGQLVDRGYVLDTIEVAAAWGRVQDLYREVIAALSAVPGVVVASGHSSHSYPQGTNIYFTFVARPDDPAEAEVTYEECWRKTMEATLRSGGTIAHHHGVGRVRLPWMAAEHGDGLDLLRALKRALDPRGILNPGALLPPGEDR